ncbi:MAG: zinc ABC transporter substrate-binding protein [Bacteroidaceae bacterium]|nr:zinc ABC transporter substrate-binding protein [Bacteroidaceae bacterium]
MMNRLLYILFFCLLCSCASRRGEDADKPMLVVSIEPMRYFVEEIAGDAFEVVTMVPRGGNPETYEPVPSQLMGMEQCDAYLRVGPIGFEEAWIERLSAIAPRMQVMDMSEGIRFVHDVHANGDAHIDEREPHVWTSPRNARIIARNICQALSSLSPADSLSFRQRWQALDSMMAATDKQVTQILAHEADSTFLIYHPTLSYFASDYGLRQLCIEEEGKEPSPAHLRTLVDACRRLGTRVVFLQQQFDRRHVEVIAAETGLRIVPIDPLGYHWQDEVLRVAAALRKEVVQ